MNLSLAILLLSSLLPPSMARLGSVQTVDNGRKLKDIKHKFHRKARKNEHHRIVNGTAASPGEFPFFVDFGYCGASLVYEDIVLTAAHCADEFVNEVYIGTFREQYGSFGDPTGDAEVREIVTTRTHPGYDPIIVDNDVMVLKINSPSSHTPIALNGDAAKPVAGEGLTAIGHGVESELDFVTPEELMKVTVPYVPHDECSASIAAAAAANFLDPDLYAVSEDTMLCAGGSGGDTCYGDSGGPLIGEDGKLVGITSWGIGCGLEGTPGIYTRISGVEEWVVDQICALSDNPPEDICSDRRTELCPHLPGTDEADCPPAKVDVRVIPPTDTGGFDWDTEPTTIYYKSLELTPLCGEQHVYQNQNGITYNLVADEEINCPDSVTFEASADGIEEWNQEISGPIGLFETSSSDGKHYCTYKMPTFAVSLHKCQGIQDGQVPVQVEIVYDLYSYENSWNVSQNGVVLGGRSAGSVDHYGLLSESIYLFPGDYTFGISDSYGDGIFDGSWKLVAGEEENGPVLIEGDGDEIGSGLSIAFTVPEGPISTAPPDESSTAPPSPGTCEDSATGTFPVNDSVGDQVCSWLAENYDRFSFLCRFTDVALTCRKTCAICDLL